MICKRLADIRTQEPGSVLMTILSHHLPFFHMGITLEIHKYPWAVGAHEKKKQQKSAFPLHNIPIFVSHRVCLVLNIHRIPLVGLSYLAKEYPSRSWRCTLPRVFPHSQGKHTLVHGDLCTFLAPGLAWHIFLLQLFSFWRKHFIARKLSVVIFFPSKVSAPVLAAAKNSKGNYV